MIAIHFAVVIDSCVSCGRDKDENWCVARLEPGQADILDLVDPKWRTLDGVPNGDAVFELQKMLDRMLAKPIECMPQGDPDWRGFGAVYDALSYIQHGAQSKRGHLQVVEFG